MKYTRTTPCSECPFLKKHVESYGEDRLEEFMAGEFPCHKTAKLKGGEYKATKDSVHCAGALIAHEKRGTTHQMMRICERVGHYDHTKLDMEADVYDG